MPGGRNLLAIGLAKKASSSTSDLQQKIENGTVVAANATNAVNATNATNAVNDENGVNINDNYAKIADIPSIARDMYPYTEEEIDVLLGIS